MRTLLVIGIGPGDPEQITVQAIKALNRVDVFFVMDKGVEKRELLRLRHVICDRYIDGRDYRFVELPDPVRDTDTDGYRAGVEAWHRARAALLETAIAAELPPNGTGGFLVWGDPSLYDSTLRIMDMIVANGNIPFGLEVIPGVASPMALAARHRIALNSVGGAVHVTTGRLLAKGWPAEADSVVAMLDGPGAFRDLAAPADATIHWGAYLGTEWEMLDGGTVSEAAPRIAQRREQARARHGWIMDTYLLRRGGKA
jgi:precorrin-6A synthase